MKNGFNYFKTDDGLSIRYFTQKNPGPHAFGSVVFFQSAPGSLKSLLKRPANLPAGFYPADAPDWGDWHEILRSGIICGHGSGNHLTRL